MTFPAWYAFHKDREIQKHPTTGRIYAALLELEGIEWVPRPVKVWVMAEALGVKKRTVIRCLDLLVERGYVVEHARDTNNVRRFTVAHIAHPKASPATSAPQGPSSSAA